MDKETENFIDELLSKGNNTSDIVTQLKNRGLTDENIRQIMNEYNHKSISTPTPVVNKSSKIFLLLLLIIILGVGITIYFTSQNSKLSSTDQYGNIYFKTLPKNLKNLKKCTQEDILGKWEYRYSSVNDNKVARIIFHDNGYTSFVSISNMAGNPLTTSKDDEIEMVEIGLKDVPQERYRLNDGMIFTDIGTGWVPIICLFANDDTDFLGTQINKGEILNVVSNENKILLYDVLSLVSK